MQIIRNIFQNPLFYDIKASRMANLLAWFMAIFSVGSVCGFLPYWLQTAYFGATALSFIYILIDGIRFNGYFFALYVVLTLNVFILPIDPLFKAKMRLLLFLIVTMVVSSAITTQRAVVFRNLIFRDLVILCSFLVPVSCLCKFIGLNFVRMDVQGMTMAQQVNQTGLFGGLFQQSMMLGPIAAIIAITFFFAYQSYGRKRTYVILFIMSALACFFSASRGAVLSMIVPIIFATLFGQGDDGARKGTRTIIIVTILAILPFADNVLNGVMEKQQLNIEMGSTFGSRNDKFVYRWTEFTNSPLMGVGFASIDPNGGDDYGEDGTVEPGSSHLAVLSMTGIVGASCYLLLIFFAYCCVKNEDDTNARFRKALLIAMILHGCWEGYVFSGGGFLCLLYWIIVGQAIDYKYLKQYGIVK